MFEFVKEMLRYLHAEGGHRQSSEALLGTTDVLESLFGKYKPASFRRSLYTNGNNSSDARESPAAIFESICDTSDISTTVDSAYEEFSMKFFDAYVLEFNPHGLSTVQLHRENALRQSGLGIGIGKVEDETIVHVVLNMIPLGDNHDIVPIV